MATAAVAGTVVSAAVPTATATTAAAAAPTATTAGISTTAVLSAAKAAVLSPVFGVAALIGIIGFEWWKGSRDAKGFASAEKKAS